ncbi:MAG: hypothetical protein FWE03_06105 [Firmicutes bacterium]|nr:hypothetical protein [Bacillota bacterium]
MIFPIVLFYVRRDLIFGFFITDEKGMMVFFIRTIKKSIDWSDIKEASIFLDDKIIAGYNLTEDYQNYFSFNRSQRFENYLILTKK